MRNSDNLGQAQGGVGVSPATRAYRESFRGFRNFRELKTCSPTVSRWEPRRFALLRSQSPLFGNQIRPLIDCFSTGSQLILTIDAGCDQVMLAQLLLSFGYDKITLLTRSMLLQNAGYKVEEVWRWPDAFTRAQADVIDALVLCTRSQRRTRIFELPGYARRGTLTPSVVVRNSNLVPIQKDTSP